METDDQPADLAALAAAALAEIEALDPAERRRRLASCGTLQQAVVVTAQLLARAAPADAAGGVAPDALRRAVARLRAALERHVMEEVVAEARPDRHEDGGAGM